MTQNGMTTETMDDDEAITRHPDTGIPFTHMIPPTERISEINAEKSRDPAIATLDKEKLFRDEQKEDASLHKCFEKAKKGISRKLKTDVGSLIWKTRHW